MKWWIVVLVLGVLLTASGTGIGRNEGSPGEITCGSEVMRPGDVCEETNRGVVTDTYTYAEKVQEEKESAAAFARTGRWIQLGLGIGLVLVGAVGIVLTKRRRAMRAPTTADLYFQRQVRERQPWPDAPLPPHLSGPPQQLPQQATQQATQQAPPHPQYRPPHPASHAQPHAQPHQQVPHPPYRQQPPPQQYPDFGPRG